jgi:hypothetical protein
VNQIAKTSEKFMISEGVTLVALIEILPDILIGSLLRFI